MRESFPLRIARQRVECFERESGELMKQHYEAMDCRDCETFLQLGIEAYDWLIRADIAIRKSIASGQADYDPEIERGLETLFREWLNPCDKVEQWIAVQHGRDYTVDNLDEFRKCREEVVAIVESLSEGDDLPVKIADLQDLAIGEFRDGNTAGCLEAV